MKQVINRLELELLERLREMAINLQDAQVALLESVSTVLLLDDAEKHIPAAGESRPIDWIEQFVYDCDERRGARWLLEELGVRVADPLVPDEG